MNSEDRPLSDEERAALRTLFKFILKLMIIKFAIYASIAGFARYWARNHESGN